MTDCGDCRIGVLCLTETHLREKLDKHEEKYASSVVGKSRSKQSKKRG